MGDMADLIAQSFPDGYWEDYESENEYIPKPKECTYCGHRNLYWTLTGNGWRLTTKNGELHSCQAFFKAKEASETRKKKEVFDPPAG